MLSPAASNAETETEDQRMSRAFSRAVINALKQKHWEDRVQQGPRSLLAAAVASAAGRLTSTTAKVPPTSASVVPYWAIWLPVRASAGHGLSRSTTGTSPQFEVTAPMRAPAGGQKGMGGKSAGVRWGQGWELQATLQAPTQAGGGCGVTRLPQSPRRYPPPHGRASCQNAPPPADSSLQACAPLQLQDGVGEEATAGGGGGLAQWQGCAGEGGCLGSRFGVQVAIPRRWAAGAAGALDSTPHLHSDGAERAVYRPQGARNAMLSDGRSLAAPGFVSSVKPGKTLLRGLQERARYAGHCARATRGCLQLDSEPVAALAPARIRVAICRRCGARGCLQRVGLSCMSSCGVSDRRRFTGAW